MKKGLTMGALAAAVLLAAGCSSSGGAPENQQQGMSQSGSMSGASETRTGTGNAGSTVSSPGGGIESSNNDNPANTQSGM